MEFNEDKYDENDNFKKYFIDKEEEEQDNISSLNDYSSYVPYDNNGIKSFTFNNNSFDSQEIRNFIGLKNEEQNPENREKLFKVAYNEKIPILTNIKNELINGEFVRVTSKLKRKRFKEKRRRRDNRDNILSKIKRRFFNKTLIKNINNLIMNKGNYSYFAKFPSKFISNITKNPNKKLLSMTLLEIFETKELYSTDDLNNFNHNMQVINKKEIREIPELKRILDKKYCELFQEYINSKEFNVDEINRLKNKFDKLYIENYIYLSKHFIEFFSN